MVGTAIRIAGTRPPDAAIRRGHAHGLDADVADRLVADFTPESPRPYRDQTARPPVDRPERLRRHHPGTGQLPLAQQRLCAERLGAGWRDDLDTGHLPTIEKPEALARSSARFLDEQAWPAQRCPADENSHPARCNRGLHLGLLDHSPAPQSTTTRSCAL